MSTKPGMEPFSTEAQLAAIVRSSNDAIFSKNPDAVILTWNPAAERLYGYTPDEIIGRSVTVLIPANRRGEERVILDQITRGERVEHYETERVTRDGRRVFVSITASPIYDDQGKILGASVISRDIAEQRRAQELEQQMERMEFVNLIAHELRNPLAAISGATQFLAEDPQSVPDDKRPLIDIIIRQAARLHTLIEDLLDLSRLRSGRFSVTLQDVEIEHAVREASLANPAPLGKSVEVAIPIGTVVMADAFRLQQILTNLLTNAYKYGGSSIRIDAQSNGRVIELSVADDGPGLPPQHASSLFEPFVRAAASGQPGSGLGLAITKGLVEALGGSIRYEQTEPQGARFVCTLLAPVPSNAGTI